MVIEQLPLDLTYSASSYRLSPLSSLVCVCSLSSKQDEKILVFLQLLHMHLEVYMTVIILSIRTR